MGAMTVSPSNTGTRESAGALQEARNNDSSRARLLLKAAGIVLLGASIGWVWLGIVSIASLIVFVVMPRGESVPVMDVGEAAEPLAELVQSALLLLFFVAVHWLGWHLALSRRGFAERLSRRLYS